MLLQLAHYSGLRLSVTQVSTACGSGRVICGKQTRPLPQAVLTRNAMSTGYMQSQTAINVGPNDADIDDREPNLNRIGISVQGDRSINTKAGADGIVPAFYSMNFDVTTYAAQ